MKKTIRKFTVTDILGNTQTFDSVHDVSKFFNKTDQLIYMYIRTGDMLRHDSNLYKINYEKTYIDGENPYIRKDMTPEEGIEYYSKLYPGEEIRYNEEYKVFVSDQGNVFSRYKKKGKHSLTDNIHGYVGFSRHGSKQHTTVHVLVMKTFGKYEEGKEVDHINGNRSDNRLCNLQMLTHVENIRKRKTCRGAYCVELDKYFDTAEEASKYVGCTQGNITQCLTGRAKTAKGYHWRYAK